MKKHSKQLAFVLILLLCLLLQCFTSGIMANAQTKAIKCTTAIPFLSCEQTGHLIKVTIHVKEGSDLGIFDFGLMYDPSQVTYQSTWKTAEYEAFSKNNDCAFLAENMEDYQYIVIGGVFPDSINYGGSIAEVTFQMKGDGHADFSIVADSSDGYDQIQANGANQILKDVVTPSDSKSITWETKQPTPSNPPTHTPATTPPNVSKPPQKTNNPSVSESPQKTNNPNISESPQKTYQPTSTVAPQKADANSIVAKDNVNQKIQEIMAATVEKTVQIITDNAPVLNKDVFTSMLLNGKKLTLCVTNEEQDILYAWNFNNKTLQNADLSVDLSIAFESSKEIADTVGAQDLLCINCACNNELPGTASVHIYVGSQFSNGENIYLYRYDTQAQEPQITLLTKDGLTVENGYVDCQIDRGASYFFSTRLLKDVKEETVSVSEWLYGDATLNQKIDLEDANEVLLAALGIHAQAPISKAASDVNLDKKVDLEDANGILLMALQIKTLEEVQNAL